MITASNNSIKGLNAIYYPIDNLDDDLYNILKAIIDLVVPDEQLNNVIKKTLNSKLKNLKIEVEENMQKEIDTISKFLNEIEKIRGVDIWF